ncbi:hypothetical protein TNCV_4853281 [Trichonephila clavipes]|nr:hypothetical protein TNCV_4853281 [Trichonephila clavipes]
MNDDTLKMVHARFACRITKTARKSANQQKCRPNTAGGGTVVHMQIPWASPRYRLLRRQSSPPRLRRSRRGMRKQDSLYGSRGRSLGKRGQVSVPANLQDHPVQSIVLDMLYPTHFASLRRNMQVLHHVGTTYEPLCWLKHFALELYILTYSYILTYRLCKSSDLHNRVFCGEKLLMSSFI